MRPMHASVSTFFNCDVFLSCKTAGNLSLFLLVLKHTEKKSLESRVRTLKNFDRNNTLYSIEFLLALKVFFLVIYFKSLDSGS